MVKKLAMMKSLKAARLRVLRWCLGECFEIGRRDWAQPPPPRRVENAIVESGGSARCSERPRSVENFECCFFLCDEMKVMLMR